jgi:hypothetical protein
VNPEHLMTTPCTLVAVRGGGTPDEYGDPTTTTSRQDTTCYIEPLSVSESGSETVELSDFRVYLPPQWGNLRGFDQLEVGGVLYDLTGDVMRWHNPRTGQDSHIEARARRRT